MSQKSDGRRVSGGNLEWGRKGSGGKGRAKVRYLGWEGDVRLFECTPTFREGFDGLLWKLDRVVVVHVIKVGGVESWLPPLH